MINNATPRWIQTRSPDWLVCGKIQTQLFLSQDANLCQYLGVSCRSLTNHGSIPIQNLITNQFLKQNSYQYVVKIILQILSRHAYIYACQCRVTDVTLLKFPLQTKIQSGSTICIRKVLQCEIASNPKLMRKDWFFFALKRENLQEALLLGRRKLVQYMR